MTELLVFFCLYFFVSKEKMANFEVPHLKDETDREQKKADGNEEMKPLKHFQARGNCCCRNGLSLANANANSSVTHTPV